MSKRHYSKVIVQMPDGPDDPPFAIVEIDCDTCGKETLQIHMAHLGTVMRTLQLTVDAIADDGFADSMGPMMPATTENKRSVREYLNAMFPGWKANQLRRRGQ